MKNRSNFRSSRAVLTLGLILTIVGCTPAVSVSGPTATSTPSSTPVPASSPTASPAPENTQAAPTSEPHTETVAANNVLYHDDFASPSTGWQEAKFDNYFIGYHEPEYYHVEIDSPNSRTAVYIPDKPIFDDATIEVKVQANSTKTAASGDYIYGPVFRRSGDQYYAFAISTVNKKWYVLKSSPSELVTLAEGSDPSIHDLDGDDTLRVDAHGSDFYFHLNGHLVAQMNDPDYPSGEVGFYVQTFDSPQAHIHFDELTVWNFAAPALCTVEASAKLNVRKGPGTSFPAAFSLSQGDAVEPVGRNPDGTWIKVGLEGREAQGWVANSSQFVSCNTDIKSLPVIIGQ